MLGAYLYGLALNYLPSPHSELFIGLLLGVKKLYEIPRFNDILVATGTIHVVVVSGYNISLVLKIFNKIFPSIYSIYGFLLNVGAVILYAGLCGFEPPVVRACIMSVFLMWGSYFGRRLEVLEVLTVSGLIMLLLQPSLLTDLSFQLSFMATLGLIAFGSLLTKLVPPVSLFGIEISGDFAASVASFLLVWPLIAFNFGRLSLLSPFINALVLWLIPWCTVLAFVFAGALLFGPLVAKVAAFFLYVPLDLFIRLTTLFSKIPFLVWTVDLPIYFLIGYYLLLCLFWFKYVSKLREL